MRTISHFMSLQRRTIAFPRYLFTRPTIRSMYHSTTPRSSSSKAGRTRSSLRSNRRRARSPTSRFPALKRRAIRLASGAGSIPLCCRPAVKQAKVFPEWWKNPKFDVDSSINHFAIDVRAERDNGKIVFAPTQEDFGLELLDMSGAVARQGVRDEIGRTTIATEGLAPGPYLMKVRRAADVSTASLSLQLVAPIDFG
jgi:hypothetical protein